MMIEGEFLSFLELSSMPAMFKEVKVKKL